MLQPLMIMLMSSQREQQVIYMRTPPEWMVFNQYQDNSIKAKLLKAALSSVVRSSIIILYACNSMLVQVFM